MGFFDKKKNSESIKTLSEKEIQSRLYGHLREPHAGQDDVPPPSKPISQENSVTHRSVSHTGKTLTTSTPSFQKPTIHSPDFFQAGESETVSNEPVKKTAHVSMPYSAKSNAPTRKPFQDRKTLAIDFSGMASKTNKIFLKTGQFFKAVGLKILGILGLVLAGLFRLVMSINFRKPMVRRISTLILGAGALALVFVAIQRLNLGREAAMKNPPKQILAPAPLQGKSKTKKSHVLPQSEAVLSEPSADEGPTQTQGSKIVAAPSQAAVKIPAHAAAAAAPASVKIAAAARPVITAPAAVEAPGYVIQVATFAAQEDAQKLVSKIKEVSLKSFSKSISRSGGRVYYCVFIGRFKTHPEADAALTEFKKHDLSQPFPDAFVRMLQ